jgi:3'(2'), 5'-bisphosphate nucleotidase
MTENTILQTDQKLLKEIVEIAINAGDLIMEVFLSRIKVRIKRNLTPVTNADIKASDYITESLRKYGIPIICEETGVPTYEERKHWEMLWIVDPLDGTKEFISGRSEFTVNIALVRKDQPVLGVIYAPALDLLYFAMDNCGSFRLDKAKVILTTDFSAEKLKEISTPIPDCKTDEYTYVVSRSHINLRTKAYLKSNKQKKVLIPKGSSLKLCSVAEGKANEYPRLGKTMEWDIAAGHAICRFADAKVLEFEKETELVYNKENLLNPDFVAIRSS